MELEPSAKDETELKCGSEDVSMKGSTITKCNILNHLTKLQKLLLPISKTNTHDGIRTKCKR